MDAPQLSPHWKLFPLAAGPAASAQKSDCKSDRRGSCSGNLLYLETILEPSEQWNRFILSIRYSSSSEPHQSELCILWMLLRNLARAASKPYSTMATPMQDAMKKKVCQGPYTVWPLLISWRSLRACNLRS